MNFKRDRWTYCFKGEGWTDYLMVVLTICGMGGLMDEWMDRWMGGLLE